jgi:hypothetical protein
MQNLFIEIKDGQPYGHPLTGENLLMIYPEMTLPNDRYMEFQLVEPPNLIQTPYKINDGVVYEIEGNVVKNNFIIRDMTAEEKADKIALHQARTSPFASWVWNEETCTYVPPVSPPPYVEGVDIYWDEATVSWKPIPTSPGEGYRFDPLTGNWVTL